jgi:CelD/BcsL family acetyltransferase involved in cellulose biosynthesis
MRSRVIFWESKESDVILELPMELRVTTDTFANLGNKWQNLLNTSCNNHIFFTHEWKNIWWSVFGGSSELLLICGYSGSELIGIAPLRRQGNTIKFNGAGDICDYLDFIAKQGLEERFITSVFDYLEKMDWQTIELESLLPQSLALNYFIPLARQKGLQVDLRQYDVSPKLDLPSNWDNYLMQLTTKNRHEVRRKLRRLEQTGSAQSYTVTQIEELPRVMDSFFNLFQMSEGEKAHFMNEQRRTFFQTLIFSMGQKNTTVLTIMDIDSIPATVSICFDYNDTVYLYNSAYDPKFSALSVSLLSKVFSINEAIKRNKKCYDFLRGNERYKYDLGGKDVPIYQCTISRV